jgi:hypothetical protein
MSKHVAKLSGWVVGILAVAALLFGLSVATARPATAMTCQNDGWNFVGSQPNQPTCQSVCEGIHGPDVYGSWNPFTTCCSCLY